MVTINRMMLKILTCAMMLFAAVACAQTWDLETDFSDSQEGPWKYQYLYDDVYEDLVDFLYNQWDMTGFNGWKLWPTGGFPCIMQNQSGGNLTFPWGGKTMYVDEIAIHPGPEWTSGSGKWMTAAVRWTAPASATYQVYGRFKWLNQGSVKLQIVHLAEGIGPPVVLYEETTVSEDWPDKEFTGTIACAMNDAIVYLIDSNKTWGGDFTGLKATVTAAGPMPGSIAGQITFEHFSGNLALAPVKVDLMQGLNVVKTQTITLTANPGSYSFIDVAPGTYDLAFSANKCLRRVVSVEVASETETKKDVTLINGDIDGDNEITSTDLSVLLLNMDARGN